MLVKEKWKIGKSPTCVDTMIRKMKKREKFLNQETKIEFGDMRIVVL